MNERSKLLWFGRAPSTDDHREAKNRGLIIEVVGSDAPPDFRHARAAVFWATAPHFEPAVMALEVNLVGAIDAGLYLYVVVENAGQRKDMARVFEAKLPKGAPDDMYRLRVAPVACHEAPNAALIHRPGPAANDGLVIEESTGVILEEEHRLLLRRAFHDCRSIKLELITGGLSGAMTFLVAATLSASNAGPNPMPYFAKLHRSDKLREEIRSFKEFAEHHIAWYLRPNFLPERCIYGVNRGILVGSFVQASKSLWEVARAGDGPRHIRSLFEETLGVLRQEANPSELGSVVEPLERFCQHLRVSKSRVEAAKQFGGTVYPAATLWRKLLNLPPQRWRKSAIHGDMHGDNVRVRKQDAIVIDFAHATNGPMSADLASLEVWFVFRVDPDCPTNSDQWQSDAELLYRPETIAQSLSDSGGETPTDWLQSCLQEIRRLARSSVYSTDEYKLVLAVYLLRQATFPANKRCPSDDEHRRAYAYWLANRLVVAFCISQVSQLEVA